VLALVILAFTAFVTPGFLTGDDEPTASSSSTTPEPTATDPSSDPSADPSSDPSSDPSAGPITPPSIPTVSPIPTFSVPPGNVPPALRKISVDFVAAVNAANKAKALALVCADDKQRLGKSLDLQVEWKSKIQIESTTGSEYIVLAKLTGTAQGRSAQGLVMVSATKSRALPCVASFLFI
jgi:hypothetical protein